MKYVLLAIFVLFAAQPLRASMFDMCNDQGTTQGSHGDMPQEDMHGGDMSHGDMQDMDCCEQDPADSHDSCDSMSHCGACTASVVALNADMAISVFTVVSRQYLSDTGEPLYRIKSPPFRPPIA
jgi:hypothetical protein